MTPILSTQNWLDYYSTYGGRTLVSVDLPLTWDTFIRQDTATSNNDSGTSLAIGEYNSGANRITRSLVKIDWSSIPAGKQIITLELLLTPTIDLANNASTLNAFRILRDVNSAQVTYTIWKTGNNWGVLGCKDATNDYDGANLLGTGSIAASPTINAQLTAITFTNMTEINKLYNGTYTDNGIVLFTVAESEDGIIYASKEHATAAYRPVARATYL